MDPNAALDALREWAATSAEAMRAAGFIDPGDPGELFNALDEWLSLGKQLPSDWERDAW